MRNIGIMITLLGDLNMPFIVAHPQDTIAHTFLEFTNSFDLIYVNLSSLGSNSTSFFLMIKSIIMPVPNIK